MNTKKSLILNSANIAIFNVAEKVIKVDWKTGIQYSVFSHFSVFKVL